MFRSPKDKKFLRELGGSLLVIELVIIASTLSVYGSTPVGVGLAVFYAALAFLLVMGTEAICVEISKSESGRRRGRRAGDIDREGKDERGRLLGPWFKPPSFLDRADGKAKPPLSEIWLPALTMLFLGLLLLL